MRLEWQVKILNKISVLVNNVILIGSTKDTVIGVIIDNPYSIQNNGQEYILTPFLENLIGQNVPQIVLKEEHIIASFDAENNEILQGYLQKISGIIMQDEKIII